MAQLVRHRPSNRKAEGWIPGQGTCPGCSSVPGGVACKRQPMMFLSHIVCFSPFVPPSLPLSLESIKEKKTFLIRKPKRHWTNTMYNPCCLGPDSNTLNFFKIRKQPWLVGSVGSLWTPKQKRSPVPLQSGHMPGLQVWSLAEVHKGQSINLSLSCQCFSPSFSPSHPLSLKINK